MCSIHIKNYLKPLCVSLKNIVVVQLLSLVQLFVSPWTAAHYASVSFTISQSLIKFMSIESVMPSNHLILCRHLLFQPSIFPSIRVFSSESAHCINWLKYWSFSFRSVLPVNIQSWFPLGLIGLIFLLSKYLSRVFSSTTIWKHKVWGVQPSLWSIIHICTWLVEKT